MAKVGVETVAILGEWYKVEIHYSRGYFYGKVPDRFPDFLNVVAGKEGMEIRENDHESNCEEHVRRNIRIYAKQYGEKLPTKRHVLIIRHNDARQTRWMESNREVNWHGFKIEWVEAYMVGKSIYTPDMKSCSRYVRLEDEAIIDYTPERAAFLQQMVESIDKMSDSVATFIAKPSEQVAALLDSRGSLFLPSCTDGIRTRTRSNS